MDMRELSAEDAAAAMLDETVSPNLPEDGTVAAVEGEKKI